MICKEKFVFDTYNCYVEQQLFSRLYNIIYYNNVIDFAWHAFKIGTLTLG